MNEKRERFFTLIEGKKAEVLRRLEALTPDAYAAGDWSPAQIGYHLMRAEEKLRAAPDGSSTRLRPIYFVGRTILRLAIPVPPPAGVETPSGALSPGEIRAGWTAFRERLRADLETAASGERFARHPLFGSLDADAYLETIDAHLTYHLKRWPA